MKTPIKGNKFMLSCLVSGIAISSFVGIVIAILIVIGAIEPKFKIGIEFSVILTQVSMLAVPIILYFFVTKDKIRDLIPLNPIKFSEIAMIVIMTLTIMPLAMLLSTVVSIFYKIPFAKDIYSLYTKPFFVPILLICVLPTIFEELALRGIVFGNYEKIPLRKAAIINGFFFGVLHLNLNQFFYTFLIGIIFCYFVYYTKSIFASMISHFIFNFSQTASGYYYYNSIKDNPVKLEKFAQTPTTEQLLQNILFLAIISLIFTPAFIILFKIFIGKKKCKLSEEKLSSVMNEKVSDSQVDNEALKIEKSIQSDMVTLNMENMDVENQTISENNYDNIDFNKKNEKFKIFTGEFWAIVIIFILILIVNTGMFQL